MIPQCKKCKYYVYTTTLGSPDAPIWHCRQGFTPYIRSWGSCIEEAISNDRITKAYYHQHPEELQLKLNFK